MTPQETIEAGRLMVAYGESVLAGKPMGLEYRPNNGSGTGRWFRIMEAPVWNWDTFEYRLAPEPTYRPWKPEEVPIGAIVLPKDNPMSRRLIVGVNPDNIVLQGSTHTFEHALKYWQMEDGSPCGVKESPPSEGPPATGQG